MLRPSILIKNTDRAGKVMDKWFVKVGKRSREFSQGEWEAEGVAWIDKQLSGK